MTDRTASHATFTVERDLAFAPATVFRAFADADAKLPLVRPAGRTRHGSRPRLPGRRPGARRGQ